MIVPQLLGVVGLNLHPLLGKLLHALDKVNAAIQMRADAIILILNEERTQSSTPKQRAHAHSRKKEGSAQLHQAKTQSIPRLACTTQLTTRTQTSLPQFALMMPQREPAEIKKLLTKAATQRAGISTSRESGKALTPTQLAWAEGEVHTSAAGTALQFWLFRQAKATSRSSSSALEEARSTGERKGTITAPAQENKIPPSPFLSHS